jgi:hypothetical protein
LLRPPLRKPSQPCRNWSASRQLVREPPKVQSYDPLTDKFRHIESTLAPLHTTPPGGEFAYAGNRLRKYRYLGRPNTGGIYDALEEYRQKVGPDPMNYRYRLK